MGVSEGTQGDFLPAMTLARALARRGEVVVVSGNPSFKKHAERVLGEECDRVNVDATDGTDSKACEVNVHANSRSGGLFTEVRLQDESVRTFKWQWVSKEIEYENGGGIVTIFGENQDA